MTDTEIAIALILSGEMRQLWKPPDVHYSNCEIRYSWNATKTGKIEKPGQFKRGNNETLHTESELNEL